jgi:hypothetical protein
LCCLIEWLWKEACHGGHRTRWQRGADARAPSLVGTDLEIGYDLLGDDLVLRVNKAGVQVFGVVLESAGRTMTGEQLLELKAESSDLVIRIGTRGEAAANVGYRLGRVAGKLLRATREKMAKP